VCLEPYSVNRTKRLIKTPKLYWNDPALALHLGHSGGWRTAAGNEVDFVLERQRQLLGVEVRGTRGPIRDPHVETTSPSLRQFERKNRNVRTAAASKLGRILLRGSP